MMSPRRPPQNDWIFTIIAVARLCAVPIWYALLTYVGVILGALLGILLIYLGIP